MKKDKKKNKKGKDEELKDRKKKKIDIEDEVDDEEEEESEEDNEEEEEDDDEVEVKKKKKKGNKKRSKDDDEEEDDEEESEVDDDDDEEEDDDREVKKKKKNKKGKKWIDKNYDKEKLEEDLERSKSTGYHKFEVGPTTIRIVPGVDGPWYKEIVSHRIPIDGGQGVKQVICRKYHSGKDCPVDEYEQKLKDSGTKNAIKLSKEIRQQKNFVFFGILRKKPRLGLQKFAFRRRQWQDIMNIFSTHGNVADVYDGYDIMVRRKGTGITDTEWSISPMPKSTQLHEDDDIIDELMEARIAWDDMVKVPSYKEAMAAIPEFEVIKKGKSKIDEEVDDEEEEDNDDEEEEEVEVKKKKKKGNKKDKKKGGIKRSRKDWTEDEEEEDDSDDEEEEEDDD